MFYRLGVVSREIGFWTTLVACHCLRVKPTVGRGSKFLGAEVAHWKILHSGVRPIVGKSLDNGISGATVGAGDKKVVVTFVFWGSEFS